MMVTMTIKIQRVIHIGPEKTVHKDAIWFSVFFLDRWIFAWSKSPKFYGAFFGGEILNSFIMDSHMKADLNCPRIHLSMLWFLFLVFSGIPKQHTSHYKTSHLNQLWILSPVNHMKRPDGYNFWYDLNWFLSTMTQFWNLVFSQLYKHTYSIFLLNQRLCHKNQICLHGLGRPQINILFYPFEITQSDSHGTRANTVSTQSSKPLFLLFELVKKKSPNHVWEILLLRIYSQYKSLILGIRIRFLIRLDV